MGHEHTTLLAFALHAHAWIR